MQTTAFTPSLCLVTNRPKRRAGSKSRANTFYRRVFRPSSAMRASCQIVCSAKLTPARSASARCRKFTHSTLSATRILTLRAAKQYLQELRASENMRGSQTSNATNLGNDILIDGLVTYSSYSLRSRAKTRPAQRFSPTRSMSNYRAVGAGAGRRIQGFDLVLRQWLLVRPDSAEE